MKRILLGLAVAALTAATAQADPGGFRPPPGAGAGGPAYPMAAPPSNGPPDTLIGAMSAPPTHPPDRYGLLPGLRKMFTLDKGCSTCKDCGGPTRGGPGGYAAAPPVNQGTLVFPHHPYVRAPRDFFMYEPGR